MKAVIHIGMPKAGTTTIQTWLKSNREVLKEMGVFSLQGRIPRRALQHAAYRAAVLEMGCDEKAAWPWPLSDLRGKEEKIDEDFRTVNIELEKLSRGSGIFTYSRERLYKYREIHIIGLDRMLSRFFEKIDYIVYIRDTVDLIVSMYSEKLRNNNPNFGTMKFSTLLSKIVNTPYLYGTGITLEPLLEWDRVLGDRLNVRLLEPDWLIKGDLIEDFASLLGVGAFCKPNRLNESFAAEYIEYVRFLNRKFGQEIPMNIRQRVNGILTAASAGKPKLAPPADLAIRIHDIHRELEERISKKYFQDRASLFSQKFRRRGVMPTCLTDRSKTKIEAELRENMTSTEWESYVRVHRDN